MLNYWTQICIVCARIYLHLRVCTCGWGRSVYVDTCTCGYVYMSTWMHMYKGTCVYSFDGLGRAVDRRLHALSGNKYLSLMTIANEEKAKEY